jgi:predicted transcriptional regulator
MLVLKKSILTSFAVSIFIGLAGCSANKPKVAKSLYVKKSAVKQHVSVKKADIVPVVYEHRSPRIRKTVRRHQNPVRRHYPKQTNSFAGKLSNAALGRLRSRVRYDGSYVKIAYPW